MPSLGQRLPLTFWLWLSPACFSASGEGDGPIRSRLALLGYSLNPLFCKRASLCLRLELLAGNLSLSLFSLWLSRCLGCYLTLAPSDCPQGIQAGTLSNAACASMFRPRLLVADASMWATSLLGVGIRHVVCGFYLFIFPPSYVAL